MTKANKKAFCEKPLGKTLLVMKEDVIKHFESLAKDGSLIALTSKQYKSVRKFGDTSFLLGYDTGYEQGKSDKEAYAKQKQIEILEKILRIKLGWETYQEIKKMKEELKRLSKDGTK